MTQDQKRVLPKDALSHVNLGHAFAEYDHMLQKKGVFVSTPAYAAASSSSSHRCIFVGRRGTGKTALTLMLEQPNACRFLLIPHLFGGATLPRPIEEFRDVRQRAFHSLVLSFKLAFLCETLAFWLKSHWIDEYEIVGELKAEKNVVQQEDFDFRFITIIEELKQEMSDEKHWLRFLNRPKRFTKAMNEKSSATGGKTLTLLVDRIDEDWDGSDPAVILLMAMLHAAVQINTETSYCRIRVFLRENIFDRVKAIDNEFARLETWVVSLDWTRELLLELVERRLQAPFNTRPALGGETWNHFFSPFDGKPSFDVVFQHCQLRPRDVLTYCDYAIEGAKSRKHLFVEVDDLLAARRKFSDTRLKDLGDEYAENFSNIGLVLSRFFGLGTRFTLPVLREIIAALIADDLVKSSCGRWIFSFSTPERFGRLFYDIGFFGIDNADGPVFRTPGWRAEAMPPLQESSVIEIHSMYHDALQLSQRTIATLDGATLREAGIVLNTGMDSREYRNQLQSLIEDIKTLPTGIDEAGRYEQIVGKVIELCFIGRLGNVEEQVKDIGNTKRRDWIAANVATEGFWEMVRSKYHAVQVVWECKNFQELDAEDFRQVRCYLNETIGLFGVLCFRGESKPHYYNHIREMTREGKLIIILNDQDLLVFLRQSFNGKMTEKHIQDRFDTVIRKVS